MSVARHHAEWLSLVEVSGPFISIPVLKRAFPQGLDARDADKAAQLREYYEDWQEQGRQKTAIHHAWIRYVLTHLLEYPDTLLVEGQATPPGMEARLNLQGETLRPDLVLKDANSGKPRLLIKVYPPDQKLDSPVKEKLWKAGPDTRMTELLHATDVLLGLVTNGEQWMLVHAPKNEVSGYASWFADLWMQEPLLLRSFHSLLHTRRFFGVEADNNLEALLRDSVKDQQEVTEQLGYQVRRAVEIFVAAMDQADADSGRSLLAGVADKDAYNAALTVMMRLVFLFAAEERGLLLLGDPLYDQHYAVSTLRDLLREMADKVGEEVLERRHDAWCRLLATFRAVHGGINHDTMRLPAYGGTLFDPDRYPFLEGRPAGSRWTDTAARPIPIDNRVVLHLLEALQILRVKIPGGGPAEARRLSFRALDIEQIGYVYEGLLDHTARRAAEPVLGLTGSKDQEPEIPLSTLEEKQAKGDDTFIEYLAEETGRSAKTLKKALETPDITDPHEVLMACGQDARLVKRVLPMIGTVRRDDFQRLEIIPEGSLYVTRGSDRRSTGTHYTPRILTEPLVKHTLDPLVYIGPAEGKPESEWVLKTAKEILQLKVCDLAMGSGAFLVQADRYLAERLVEAWEIVEKNNPGRYIVTPDGELSTGSPTERLMPRDPAERIAIARRCIADRCLYGVDINPMAVEMAKLSLWLITLQKDRPFTFLDHALKCGDSLLGVTDVKQVENFSLRPGERQITFATANLFRYVEDAAAKRRKLEELPSDTPEQTAQKAVLHAEAESAAAKVKALADCLIAFELRGINGVAYEDQRTAEAEKLQLLMKRDADARIEISNPQSALARAASEILSGRRPFHWAVEFPEVFACGGFDAIVGNPPFMSGKGGDASIAASFGSEYTQYLETAYPGSFKSADLSAFFFRRSFAVLANGSFGLLATKTIAEGKTRETGLLFILSEGGAIFKAERNHPWPGVANVHVSVVWVAKGFKVHSAALDGTSVDEIDSYLTSYETEIEPAVLRANSSLSYQGTKPRGDFCIPNASAFRLLSQKPSLGKVLVPYVRGEDVKGQVEPVGTEHIIDFARDSSQEPSIYEDLFAICEKQVREYRSKQGDQRIRNFWWLFEYRADELYQALRGNTEALCIARLSNHWAMTWVRPDCVFSDQVVVFIPTGRWWFAVLQSSFHESWCRRFGKYFKGDFRYNSSDCFYSFPLPEDNSAAGAARAGEIFFQARRQVMQTRQEGLTKTYNRFHDRSEQSQDIAQLRALHNEMDQAVAAAYGWTDLDLGHGFHKTKQGIRYTISESARRTVLDRLLALNHQRYEEEVKAGLHEKKKGKGKPGGKKSNNLAGSASTQQEFNL